MRATFPDLSRFDYIALDTETTGLGYTDKPVNITISTPDGHAYAFAFGHPTENNCDLHQVQRWWDGETRHRSDLLVVMLNAVYDMRMLGKVGLRPPSLVEDVGIIAALLDEYEPDYTLEGLSERKLGESKHDEQLNEWCATRFGGKPTRSAQAKNYHRAPGNIVSPYGIQDANLTRKLYDLLHPRLWDQDLMPLYQVETMLIPVLYRMYMAGVKVDVAKAEQTKRQFEHKFRQLEQEWVRLAGKDVNTNSTQQLAKVFDRYGIPYNWTKPSKTFPNGQPSITKEVLEQCDHPIGQLLRSMRQLEHYSGTFIENYLLANLCDGDLIHPSFHSVRSAFGGTITGRFSSSGGLNAQNIPSRDEELAPLIRGLFIPVSADHQWLKADYSQIEYRFFGHYAGGQLRAAYVADPFIDFHDMVAEMTGLARRPAKNINFGILYGMGQEKMARQLGVSLEDAQQLLDQYHGRIPEAKRLYNGMMNRGSRRGYVITWGGRRNRFMSVGNTRKKYLGTHTALNKVLQGSAADLIKKAMVDVDQHIDWESEVLHLTVHDELDLSIPKGKAGQESAAKIKRIMQDYPVMDPRLAAEDTFNVPFHPMTVPIISDVEVGPDWGHCEEILQHAA